MPEFQDGFLKLIAGMRLASPEIQDIFADIS